MPVEAPTPVGRPCGQAQRGGPAPSSAGAKVTVILPTLDEAVGVAWFMPKLSSEWFDELIVVDGGSTDGTVEWCRAHGYRVIRQVSHELWGALADAFQETHHDIIVTASPDGNCLPELLPRLTAKLREGYDMVIASRYLDGAVSHDDDRWTAVGNRVFTKLINIVFGASYTDTLGIYRAYTRDAIRRMRLDQSSSPGRLRRLIAMGDSWDVASSIRAAKLKLRVAEIPGDEPLRIGGVRKLSVVRGGLTVLIQVTQELWKGRGF